MIELLNCFLCTPKGTHKDEICRNCQASSSFARLTVNWNDWFSILSKVEDRVEAKFEHFVDRARIVILKGKISHANLPILLGLNLTRIHKIVIAHVVDFGATVVILFEKGQNFVPIIPEKLINASPRKSHGNHARRNVAQIQIELFVCVAESIFWNNLLQVRRFVTSRNSGLSLINLLHQFSVRFVAKLI